MSHFSLIKVLHPYDYVSSIDKFSETQLPPKSEFYSKLNDEDICDSDYQHAIKVWNKFNCKTICDYHNLYLKSEVLLLADVFENFRKTGLKHYSLDTTHYFKSPGLAWDACLKETRQELELLHDYDMLMMFEKGNRGGITHISKRYAEANNKYMSDFNPNKPSTFIQYGCAKSQRLPTHGFKWLKDLTVESNATKELLSQDYQTLVTYLKSIVSIQRNSGINIMIIHLHRKNSRLTLQRNWLVHFIQNLVTYYTIKISSSISVLE